MSKGHVPSQALPEGYKRADLTREQILELNARRAPAFRIDPDDICGAKLSDKVIEKNREKGVMSPVCNRKPGSGTAHPGIGYCKWHGGNTTAGLKHAAKLAGKAVIREQKDVMMIEDAKFGGDRTTITISPEEALLEEVRRSVAMVRWLEERIGQWRTVDPTNSDSTVEGNSLPPLVSETSRGAASFTNEREWLLLYRQEREQAARIAALAIGAGIAERMVHIAEDQGRMLAIAVRAVLEAMNLTPDQVARVPLVVPNILRQVSIGMPIGNPEVAPLPSIAPDLSLVRRPGASEVPGYIQGKRLKPGDPGFTPDPTWDATHPKQS